MTAESTTVGPPIGLVVGGAAGRMGTRIVALARESPDPRVVAALEAPGHPALGSDTGTTAQVGAVGVAITSDAAAAITAGRVLVEFSDPEASLEHLRLVAAAGACAVIGTTGVPFTSASIGMAMASRELMSNLRAMGEITGGPKPMTARDRSRFLSSLDEAIQRLRRQSG